MMMMTTPSSLKQPEFGEVEDWLAPSNSLNRGYFSAIDPIAWEGCRERFSSAMRKEGFKGFYIVHDEDGNGDNIANFIFKTEEILNLPERTTYAKTTCDRILRIYMTDFWMSTYIRRSFFTILPRIGNYYKSEKDYEKLLFNPSVSPANGWSNTVPAIKRFLYGFTEYDAHEPEYNGATLETSGWCRLFSKENAWKRLVKEEQKPVISPIAIGKLWG